MKLVSLLFMAAAFTRPAWSESLNEALERANSFSPALKALSTNVEAARLSQKASFTRLLPTLSLEGNYFYQTNVPTIKMPGLGSFSAGAHHNYTIGPVLRYTLFDGLAARKNYQGADLTALSKIESLKSSKRELQLAVQLAYFKSQLALKSIQATGDVLKLAQAQSRDIDLRLNAGASSKLDQYSARRNVMTYQLKYEQSQAALQTTLRDLAALLGNVTTDKLTLEPQEQTLSRMLADTKPVPPDAEQPAIKSIMLSLKASELSVSASKGSLWPKIDLLAKSQWLYPNLIVPAQAWNNVFMVNLYLPLWLGDSNWNTSQQRAREASAIRYQKDQKLLDLLRDYQKALDLVQSLKLQQETNAQLIEQTQQIAKLTFQSYKAGSSKYLDVETSNTRLLEAQLGAAQTDEQLLAQLATLQYLSSPGETARE
ncbi:MAG: TolC family protein [Myxococcota bacterium]